MLANSSMDRQLVNSLAIHRRTDNWSTQWRIRRRTDNNNRSTYYTYILHYLLRLLHILLLLLLLLLQIYPSLPLPISSNSHLSREAMASRSGRRGEFPPESKQLIENAMTLDDNEQQPPEPAGRQPRRTSRTNSMTSTSMSTSKSKPKMSAANPAKKPSTLLANSSRPSNNSASVSKIVDGCMVCHRDVDHANLLLCEACNDEYHTYCLNPPLQSVPEGDFFCGKKSFIILFYQLYIIVYILLSNVLTFL